MAKDRVSAVMGGKKSSKKPAKKKAKKVAGMHVRKAANGGFITKHDDAPDGEENALQDMAGLQQHMSDHMGDEPQAGAAPAMA
jgi:hypothetical protein